jgi:aryl-alcohol dehydrogenase-like predicted oxidoreductase/enamine deaminase RidA (YjgF/YER057c/UK114 family)
MSTTANSRNSYRVEIAPGLKLNRVVTGLWQVADLERNGTVLDLDKASDALLAYVDAGFTSFDMADHYGSAELIAGEARRKLQQRLPAQGQHNSFNSGLELLTKWCPEPHQFSVAAVRQGIEERRRRLGVDTIDLLQLHWWKFDHPGYIDVMDCLMSLKQEGLIAHIGVTNFDTDHLHLLLSSGYEIACNQVCLSVLDQRALGDMSQLCMDSGVRLLAYGTLAGGFLSDRWLQRSEPSDISDWSKMKYRRFIDAVGGWEPFQEVLLALNQVAEKHSVTLASVAIRWVLQQAAVGSVIVGARITQHDHRQQNQTLFGFSLSDDDCNIIDTATSRLNSIAGDCGREYRQPPYLTASGDLSHHMKTLPKVYDKIAATGRNNRWRISSNSRFESICGYSRAVREGNRVLVSGTTATHGADRAICSGDVRGQAVYILDKLSAALDALGASLEDVIRTRIYMKDCTQWQAVSLVHGRYFCDCLPANTLIEVRDLVGPYDIEIELEAVVEE